MPESRPPKDKYADSTRERLIDAAIQMFAERGYAASGVDALCRRAGVAKTGLYWEFQSKAGLLNAVVDRVMAVWMEEVLGVGTEIADPRERLDRVMVALRERSAARPELFRVILVVLAERTQVDEEARDALRRFFESARTALATLIHRVTASELPDETVDTTADLIIALIEGLFLRMQVYGEVDPRQGELFDGARRAILLLLRETIANAQGKTTLAGRVLDIAIPNPTG
jgi:AcrR family transcriptional regulator